MEESQQIPTEAASQAAQSRGEVSAERLLAKEGEGYLRLLIRLS